MSLVMSTVFTVPVPNQIQINFNSLPFISYINPLKVTIIESIVTFLFRLEQLKLSLGVNLATWQLQRCQIGKRIFQMLKNLNYPSFKQKEILNNMTMWH